MMLAAELAAELAEAGAERRIAEVRLGRAYAAVRLDSGEIGLGHMPYEPAGIRCLAEPAPRPVVPGRALAREDTAGQDRPWHSAADLARDAGSENGVNAATGLAALNAIALSVLGPAPTGDVRQWLDLTPDDHVAMVGRFAPLVRWIGGVGARLTILEKRTGTTGGTSRSSVSPVLLPADEAPAVLPRCSVALITSTTLVNHTLAALLPLCGGAREVVLLGPSTPLAPAFFAARGVTVLAGVRPADPEALLRIVGDGGGMQQFKTVVHKVALRLDEKKGALIPKVYRDTADHGVDNGKTVPRHGDLSLWRHRQG